MNDDLTLYIRVVDGKDADYAYVVYDKLSDSYNVVAVWDGREYLRFTNYETLRQATAMVNDLVTHREDW